MIILHSTKTELEIIIKLDKCGIRFSLPNYDILLQNWKVERNKGEGTGFVIIILWHWEVTVIEMTLSSNTEEGVGNFE